MTPMHVELLDNFLADPKDPRWSSTAMDRMFAAVNGDSKQKLMTILNLVDDRLSDSCCTLTVEQTEFLRSATLFAYTTGCISSITPSDVDWLLKRFHSLQTPQRALTIALLLQPDELPPDTQTRIHNLLVGTPGERFLDTSVVTDADTT